MPAYSTSAVPIRIDCDRATRDALLIGQLQRVHHELLGLLAIAADTPAGAPSDAALARLCQETNAFAHKFLDLSANLLARPGAIPREQVRVLALELVAARNLEPMTR